MKTILFVIIALSLCGIGLTLEMFGNDIGLIFMIFALAFIRVGRKQHYRKQIIEELENEYKPKI